MTCATSDSAPAGVAGATVTRCEKIRSPATASPFVPSSKSVSVAPPPMGVRSAVTSRPVLTGLAPGTAATATSVVSPAATLDGTADPTPDGSVGPFGLAQTDARFCGSLAVRYTKSFALSLESVPLPSAPPGRRS